MMDPARTIVFRHGALAAEPTGLLVDDCAIAFVTFGGLAVGCVQPGHVGPRSPPSKRS